MSVERVQVLLTPLNASRVDLSAKLSYKKEYLWVGVCSWGERLTNIPSL